MNLIIFDLDGTLVKLPIDYEALRHRLYLTFDNRIVLDSIYRFLIHLDPKSREKAFRIMDKFELESIPQMYIDPTIHEGFRLIRDYTKALVTLQGWRPVIKILEEIGIRKEFSMIVTREYSLNRTEQLMYVLDRLNADRKRTVFIGDTQNDLEAAKIIGIFPIIMGSKIDGNQIKDILSAIRIAISRLEKQ